MSITLAYNGTTLTLNPDLYWSDEDWLPVTASTERTLTGALIVSTAAITGGRPITLQPYDESSGWTPYATLTTLRNWAAVPARVMQLTIRGQSRNVIFRHEEKAIESEPVIHFSDVDNTDWNRVVLRFLEV